MALPTNNSNPHLDSGHTHHARPLWFRIVQTTRSSLIHDDTPSHPSVDGVITLKSLVFRVGQSDDSLMFDVSSRKESQSEFYTIVAEQLPHRWGVTFHQEGSRKIVEVYFTEECDANDALVNGLIFLEDKIRILPIRALREEAKVVRLSLSNIPFMKEEDTLFGLNSRLKQFGKVLDVGLTREKKHQTYIGQGYAVLDVFQSADAEEKYTPLNHNISWGPSTTRGFRATWHNMPPYCVYCHDGTGNHTAVDCPDKAPRNKRTKLNTTTPTCWNCDSTQHLKRDCPKVKPRKSTTTTTMPDYVDESMDEDLPMMESHAVETTLSTSIEPTIQPEQQTPASPPTTRSATIVDLSNNDTVEFRQPIDHIMSDAHINDGTFDTRSFTQDETEIVGRLLNVDNNRKASKIIRDTPESPGEQPTTSLSSQ